MDDKQFRNFSKKIVAGENDCILWVGAKNGGYGSFGMYGKTVGAHRVAYEHFVGPVPAGLELDHKCRNKACVNPGHLEPVPHAVNIRRGEGICAKYAQRTHCKYGHQLTGENIYYYAKTNARICKACVRSYNKNYWKTKGNPRYVSNRHKTHCNHGHEFTPENTIYEGSRRHCRECGREAQRKRYTRMIEG